MKEYPKIDTVFKRDPATNFKRLMVGEFSQEAFAYLASNEWVFTEKVDGTNIRVIVDPTSPQPIRFGGKTDAAQIPAQLVSRLESVFLPLRDSLCEQFPSSGCLYGEGYGAKIQKGGGNYSPTQEFVLFDVRVGEWWLQRNDVEEIASRFGLRFVPVIARGTLYEMVDLARAGFGSAWGKFQAEGIVARPGVELRTRSGGRVITKIKHRDFDQQPEARP